jgi:NTE family protein
LDEITFNSSLLAELRAADFVARLIRPGVLDSEAYRLERLHRIGGAGRLESFDASTKFNVSWPFLQELRDLGREDTKAWLAQSFDAIGVEGTLDIDRALKRVPAKDLVRGAPAAG